MRHRFAPPAGDPGHPFSSVMQRILRQTEVLLQRRIPFSPSSTWDEWTEALAHQSRGSAR